MSSNPRLAFFQSMLGQPMNQSPSALGRWLGGTLRQAEYGNLVVEYTVREEMTNPAFILHGGAAAAILDDIAGAMVFTLNREYAFTSVNLNIDFLHSARLGDTILATAQLIREGKNIIHVESVIKTTDGKIIAKAATNLIQTSMKMP